MHVFIMTDLEGISGVEQIEMINPESDNYGETVSYLMSDANAAIAGAFAGGATRVSIVDGHGSGKNFDLDKLDPRAERIPASVYSKRTLDEWDIDAFFIVGAHAMAGTVGAFLDHTQSSIAWFDYKINGKSHGEIGQEASFFGLKDIPLIFVSGDRAACLEASSLIKNIVTASVKTARIRNRAECVPVDEARALIFEGAKKAVEQTAKIKPYKIDLPVTIEVTHTRNDY